MNHNRYVTQESINLILTASISIQKVTDLNALLTVIFNESPQSIQNNYKSIIWNIPRPLPPFFLIDLVFIPVYLLVGLLILITVCWAGCVLWLRLFQVWFDWLSIFFVSLFWFVYIIWFIFIPYLLSHRILHILQRPLTLILPRSRTGTVWFYTSTSNKRAARPKLSTKSLTRDLKLMYSRFTLVRISIKL